jgi:hypothetical protein
MTLPNNVRTAFEALLTFAEQELPKVCDPNAPLSLFYVRVIEAKHWLDKACERSFPV